MPIRQATIRVFEGSNLLFGQNLEEQSMSISGPSLCSENTVVRDNYGVMTLWENTSGSLPSFTHGYIKSDRRVLLQLFGGAPLANRITCPLEANTTYYFTGKVGTGFGFTDGTPFDEGANIGDVRSIQLMNNVAPSVGDATVDWILY